MSVLLFEKVLPWKILVFIQDNVDIVRTFNMIIFKLQSMTGLAVTILAETTVLAD